MSYESVIKQVKNTPERYLPEIARFIEFLNQKIGRESPDGKTAAQRFLELSWEDSRDADEIIGEIESSRKNSVRFGGESEIFD